MPATNLLFARKDDAFDCFDQISGKIKQKIVVASQIPAIPGVLQQGTVLVLTAHGAQGGTITLGPNALSASAYAGQVLAQITNRTRISKIVYIVCYANTGVVSLTPTSQVASPGVITFDGSTKNLRVGTNPAMSVNQVIALGATQNGWTYTP